MTDANKDLIDELRIQREDAKARVAAAEADLEEINDRLRVELSKIPERKIIVGDYVPSLSQPHRWEYDWDAIKKKIGAIKWRQVVDEVPNPDKLAKVVSADIIANYAEKVPYGKERLRVDNVRKEGD